MGSTKWIIYSKQSSRIVTYCVVCSSSSILLDHRLGGVLELELLLFVGVKLQHRFSIYAMGFKAFALYFYHF